MKRGQNQKCQPSVSQNERQIEMRPGTVLDGQGITDMDLKNLPKIGSKKRDRGTGKGLTSGVLGIVNAHTNRE